MNNGFWRIEATKHEVLDKNKSIYNDINCPDRDHIFWGEGENEKK